MHAKHLLWSLPLIFMIGLCALLDRSPALEGHWSDGDIELRFDGSTATILRSDRQTSSSYHLGRVEGSGAALLHWAPDGDDMVGYAFRIDQLADRDELVFLGRGQVFTRVE
jgi:hypothetical protein